MKKGGHQDSRKTFLPHVPGKKTIINAKLPFKGNPHIGDSHRVMGHYTHCGGWGTARPGFLQGTKKNTHRATWREGSRQHQKAKLGNLVIGGGHQ